MGSAPEILISPGPKEATMEIKRGTTTSKKGKSVKDLPVKGKIGRKVKGGFEIKDYGFGVEMPTTVSSSTTSTTTKK
jgi:hypothetical protein